MDSEEKPSASEDSGAGERLQCIGSFVAFTPAGDPFTIEIWTHFASVHDRERVRVEPTRLVLTTSKGVSVKRIDQGEYCLRDNPEITFSTDDPNAP